MVSVTGPLRPQKAAIDKAQAREDRDLDRFARRVREVIDIADESVHLSNDSAALSHHANEVAARATEVSNNALEISNRAIASAHEAVEVLAQTQALPARIERLGRNSMDKLEKKYNRLRDELEDIARTNDEHERENKVQIQVVKIHEKHRLGIFEQEEKIRAQAAVNVEQVRWDKIKEMLTDPVCIAKVVLGVTAMVAGFYVAKYGISMFMDYWTQPGVICETSKTGLLGWTDSEPETNLNDLIFAPPLQQKLFDLVLRVQSAKSYNENLPNVLFYGISGTGKTAFAKALAQYSGLDYALTSGSEFSKITDLNVANNELRKLLNWAQDNDKGLIVFIDEAESLFANRKLVATPKSAQDFINTFLALVSEKSQKNLMFIFATNHPFKLDDAITNRIGINIEFTLPEAPEREKILATYLAKLAQENVEAIVEILPEIMESLPAYADILEGHSHRALKFIAEEMIVAARRQHYKRLTTDIADIVLNEAVCSLEQAEQWKKEREEWAAACAA